MSSQIMYHPLFTVTLWHGYYLHPAKESGNAFTNEDLENLVETSDLIPEYSILGDLEITPASATVHLMQNYKMVYRQDNTGFVVGICVEKDNSGKLFPRISLEEILKLSFIIRLKNTNFVNFTNLGLSDFRNKVYHFGNSVDQKIDNTLYLSRTPPYVGDEDRYAIHDNTVMLDVASLELEEIRLVFTSPIPMNSFQVTCTAPEGEDFLNMCDVYLSGRNPGLYELSAFTSSNEEIPSLKQSVYLNNGGTSQNILGVIDIFHFVDDSLNDYALLDNDGSLLSPEYTLWWQNRLTQWRYLFEIEPPSPDTDCDVVIEPEFNKNLISKAPQALINRYRKIRFQHRTDDGTGQEEILFPNPSAARIYPENATVYSEVYMGQTDFTKTS
jgi:hypothetical protein